MTTSKKLWELLKTVDPHELRENGCGPVIGFYAKGHHDPTEFAAAVERGYGVAIASDSVRQQYARVVGDWSEGYREPALQFQKSWGLGAFRVTVWEKP